MEEFPNEHRDVGCNGVDDSSVCVCVCVCVCRLFEYIWGISLFLEYNRFEW